MANEQKKRRSRADYEALLAERDTSGLTLRAFAESVGIKPATLYSWNRRLRAKQRYAEETPRLAPLQVVEAEPTTPSPDGVETTWFELTLGDERVLLIPVGFDSSELRRLLAVLQA